MDKNLTLLLFGNTSAVQFQQDNYLLGETEPNIEDVTVSRTVPFHLNTSESRLSVINLIGLHESSINLDDLSPQLVSENDILAFIFVVRLGQLTDADKTGIEWLQKVFGEEVLRFVMLLFTYECEEESDSFIDDLKNNSALERLIVKCGGRYHICSRIMNVRSELVGLMDRIEILYTDNNQQCYACEREDGQRLFAITERKTKKTLTTVQRKNQEGDKQSMDGAKKNQNKQDVKRGEIEEVFKILHLDKRPHCKLKAADVLQQTEQSLQSQESCAKKHLAQTFLQKLIAMNYRARYIRAKECENQDQQADDDLPEIQGAANFLEEMSIPSTGTNRKVVVHPMDVQMAVFHCADIFLKQLIVNKLSQCQYALPLLVPNPFTQEIEFPLWTFRHICKVWKLKEDAKNKISKVQPVCTMETPMVFFFRFGSVSFSKSTLMNNLINERHNTFFHKDCPGGSKNKVLMEGVVEITWYCPSGKESDTFSQCVAFSNLHGDAGDNERQLQILSEMASVNVVILQKPDENDKKATTWLQNLYSIQTPLICLFTEEVGLTTQKRPGKFKICLKNKNGSEASEEVTKAISACLSDTTSVFRLEDLSRNSEILVDENNDADCRNGKKAAQKMMGLLAQRNQTEIKETLLPCQGELWHLWCLRNKELHRTQLNELDVQIKQNEMMEIRRKQHALDLSDFMKLFIEEMQSQKTDQKMFFLKWLTILLEEFTSADLSELHHKYNEKWSEARALSTIRSEQVELDQLSKELQAATFGLEHILRELGQIYESCKSINNKSKDLPVDYTFLPSLAADMMISGFPLELMDGDAAHLPVVWVNAVLQELTNKLGNKKVFVMSVLGVQSSGKSTMLNAMFGLQFAVGVGRCTRGAFMQLVKVSEEMKMKEQLKFDYILVVDTEGLHALEMSVRSRHHDNEIATFLVGLGNLTLINIFGESPAELQEILQIVVQAFMRMKQVRLKPSCMFVHQNVSDVTAREKTMDGRRRLLETLDQMAKLAAKDEHFEAKCFNDVISFDIQNDVKYFAQLWEGSPPMAPPNPEYCYNIQELKRMIFSHASKAGGSELSSVKKLINDLWNGLLDERFVFSFRNSLEVATYRRLETEYSKWSWSLRRTLLDIENKLHNQIDNDQINIIEGPQVMNNLKEKSEEVEGLMSNFFETDKDKDILIQWKESFNIKVKELQSSIVIETTKKLNTILQQRELKARIDAQRTRDENILFEKSKELAVKLKDKTNDEAVLQKEFDSFWRECVQMIKAETPEIKNIDVLTDIQQLLSNDWKSPRPSRDIFLTHKYSDYIQLRTSDDLPSDEVKFEKQIKKLVDEISKDANKLMNSFNFAKMGYNKIYLQELLDHIKNKVTDFEENSKDFLFKKEFFPDLVMSIGKKENKLITVQHRKFREAYDPIFHFEKKRENYYSIFQKYCQGSASAAIFGEIICQKMKDPIQKSVYNDTARDLTNEIQASCESLNGNRSKLEKHMLISLAKQEDFEKYINYLFSPRDHLKNFVRDEITQYLNDKFDKSVQPKMRQNIKLMQDKIMKAAQRATLVNTSKDVQKWLDDFTVALSDMLTFSIKDLQGVSHDGVEDFKLLEDVIGKLLEVQSNEILNQFSTETFLEYLEPKNSPEEILSDHLSNCCWVQCPFCGATCTNTVENHSGDHSVLFHRVNGLTGCSYDENGLLSSDFCSNLVKSYKRFYADQWIHLKEYRKAGNVYAEWSITPDLSNLPYWKWFVSRFHDDLEKYFNKMFNRWDQISEEWGQFTKEQAIESLDEYI